MNDITTTDLQKRLDESELIIKKLKKEAGSLKKAIWDMLNYSSLYLVLLDQKMIIKLCNWSLAKSLGYETEKDIVGQCWLNFIPEKDIDRIKMIHNSVANKNDSTYEEVINDIKTKDGKIISVKWFNLQINNNYHMTMSLGLHLTKTIEAIQPEDSIRSFYRDVIDKDRTMIKSLRDVVFKGVDNIDACEIDEG